MYVQSHYSRRTKTAPKGGNSIPYYTILWYAKSAILPQAVESITNPEDIQSQKTNPRSNLLQTYYYLLPIQSKILEKLLLYRIILFLEMDNTVPEHQFSFKQQPQQKSDWQNEKKPLKKRRTAHQCSWTCNRLLTESGIRGCSVRSKAVFLTITLCYSSRTCWIDSFK